MAPLVSFAERMSRWLAWAGGTLIVLSALLVTLEVILRKIFNISLGGADEISGYAFGVATSFALAFALFERAHIRVDAAYNLFPRWGKLAANLIGIVLLTGFGAVVAYMAWGLVADTLQHGSRSITPMRTPLAIPQIPWLAGWIFFVLCGALLFIAALIKLLKGQPHEVDKLIGIKSIDEQIEDEAPDLHPDDMTGGSR
jgi:TRAP-type C4-dicarboxylate transport system permease small subunit